MSVDALANFKQSGKETESDASIDDKVNLEENSTEFAKCKCHKITDNGVVPFIAPAAGAAEMKMKVLEAQDVIE